VVAYRVPRGLGLIRPASFCPSCRQSIAWHDNLPVVGWLRLHGRCRHCKSPISPRYPLVEAALGCVFLGLAIPELWLAGVNLPLTQHGRIFISIGTVLTVNWQLAWMYTWHVLVMTSLAAWLVLSIERHTLPRLTVGLAAVAFATAVAVWPGLHPKRITIDIPGSIESGRAMFGLVQAAAGLTAGWVLGWMIQFADRDLARLDISRGLAEWSALVGAALGWAAVVAVLAMAAAVRLVQIALCRAQRPSPWAVFVVPATLTQLAAWRLTADVAWWPGPQSPWFVSAAYAAAAVLLSAVPRMRRSYGLEAKSAE
jgi:leader peptidase (prepilin peptidase)/N-methyltransferase